MPPLIVVTCPQAASQVSPLSADEKVQLLVNVHVPETMAVLMLELFSIADCARASDPNGDAAVPDPPLPSEQLT